MDTYYSTQQDRSTPFITDGLRRYSGTNNPQYIIEDTSTKRGPQPVKVELTSDIQKTIDQVKEEMVLTNSRATKKMNSKRKRSPAKKPPAKRRKVYKKITNQKKSYTIKKAPSKRRHTVFNNGSKKR